MAVPTNLAQAFHQGAWLPCRILERDATADTVLVRVTDRGGAHDVWLASAMVRGR